jgi:hypothetical protein
MMHPKNMVMASNLSITRKCEWKFDGKSCCFAKRAGDRQAAPMPIDDMFHNCKPKARTANLA